MNQPIVAIERLQRAVPSSNFPSRPGAIKCANFMRFGTCRYEIQCKFDHPKPIRVEEKLESAIRDHVPELNFLIQHANQIREACERCSKLKRQIVDDVISPLIYDSITKFFDVVETMMPLAAHVVSSSMASETVVHSYQLYIYFEFLPKLIKTVKSILPRSRVDERCYRLSNKFLLQERRIVTDITASISPAAASPHSSSQRPALFPSLDIAISSFAAEQTRLMADRAAVYESVRSELLHSLSTPFRCSGYEIKLDPFGSVASSLGSPKSDLDLSVRLIPIAQGTTSMTTTPAFQSTIAALICKQKYLEAVLECLNLEAPLDDADIDIGVGDEEEDGYDDEEDSAFSPSKSPPAAAGLGAVVSPMTGGKEGKEGRRTRSGSMAPSSFTVREFVSAARVPVLKLHHPATGTDIDLIHSNINGLTNTQLLRQYAQHDPRVRPLILAVKRWSSSRGVNDAHNSTLSSYAWVLLVIFFCQTRQPPVLPNLQASGEPYALQPERSSGVPELCESAPVGTDTTGVGELLLQFFLYYAAHGDDCFHGRDYVAAVRHGRKIPKSYLAARREPTEGLDSDREMGNATPANEGGDIAEELFDLSLNEEDHAGSAAAGAGAMDDIADSSVARNAMPGKISIEDPIELSHDLGSVIHNPLGQMHIMSELRRGLLLFQSALKSSFQTDFFDILCQPNPDIPKLPFNRVCRVCLEEGHNVRDCPLFVCHKCLQRGHIARNCTEKVDRRRRQSNGRGGGGNHRNSNGRGGGRGGEGKLWSPGATGGQGKGRR